MNLQVYIIGALRPEASCLHAAPYNLDFRVPRKVHCYHLPLCYPLGLQGPPICLLGQQYIHFKKWREQKYILNGLLVTDGLSWCRRSSHARMSFREASDSDSADKFQILNSSKSFNYFEPQFLHLLKRPWPAISYWPEFL